MCVRVFERDRKTDRQKEGRDRHCVCVCVCVCVKESFVNLSIIIYWKERWLIWFLFIKKKIENTKEQSWIMFNIKSSLTVLLGKSIYLSIYLHTHTHTRARARAHTHTHIYVYIYVYIYIERERERERERISPGFLSYYIIYALYMCFII